MSNASAMFHVINHHSFVFYLDAPIEKDEELSMMIHAEYQHVQSQQRHKDQRIAVEHYEGEAYDLHNK